MRLRLGLLQDPAVIERQIAREEKAAEARRKKDAIPTVKTEEQMQAEELAAKKEHQTIEEKVKERHKPKIRPLSEAKAIETGANFASEMFLFLVAAGLIVGEAWRQRRKEGSRREDVADRIEALEAKAKELEELKERLTVAVLNHPAKADDHPTSTASSLTNIARGLLEKARPKSSQEQHRQQEAAAKAEEEVKDQRIKELEEFKEKITTALLAPTAAMAKNEDTPATVQITAATAAPRPPEKDETKTRKDQAQQ